MDGIAFGRFALMCASLLFTAQVSRGAVVVKVTPMVEALRGASSSLPCSHTVSPPSANMVVEWYIVAEPRIRVAFHSQSGDSGVDPGTPLSGRSSMAQDSSLVIDAVQPSDEGVFVCQVTGGPAGMGEASTQLKVFFAPEKPELTQPSTQAITVGESSSSEIGVCEAKNGYPLARIIWFKNDQPLAEVKDTKEKTYMVPSVVKEASDLFTVLSGLYMQPSKEDKGSVFKCTVEYTLPNQQIQKKTSDPITINLNYPSETATFMLVNAGPVKEGDMVTMKCETDGNPQPEFDFTKDGNVIAAKDGVLMLKAVKRSDAGVYKCKATDFDNLDADLSGEITLAVSFIDPVSVVPAGPLEVTLGQMVEVQCKTKSSGPHTVQWKKGSEVLSQTGVLSIEKVSFENAGQYMCVGAVPDVPGLTAMGSVNITVKGPPMIETPVNGLVKKQGEMVTLKCFAYGFPAPQFTWKPSGKESVSLEDGKVVSSLTLEASAEVMKEGVTCEVSNELGKDSKMFSVSIQETRNDADLGSALSHLLLLSSLLLSGLFVQTL